MATFSTTGSLGVYRDDNEQSHYPMYYSFSYSGFHSNGIESRVDMIMNNDFSINEWHVMPSQAQVIVPLTQGYVSAPYRQTRIEAGRSLFAEGFDLALLDGAKVPFYWSEKGGGTLYGGWARTLDLYEDASSPISGLSLFQDVYGYFLKAGLSAHREGFDQKYIDSLVFKQWDVWLSPAAMYKLETDVVTGFNQSLTELTLTPMDSFSVTLQHSLRNPRRVAENEDVFLYKILATSPVEVVQGAFNLEITEALDWQVILSNMRYKSGALYSNGDEQETNLQWRINSRQSLSPVFRHLKSYGGELWDSGLNYQVMMTDRTRLKLDLAAAYFNKINGIHAWAYQARNGIEFLLGPNFSTMTWVEVERNHLYAFDARVYANVTYFQ